MALTAKQEAFAVALAAESTAADAYRGAYDCKKMSDNAIYREASLLSADPKITQRIAEIRNGRAAEAGLEETAVLKRLAGVIHAEEGKEKTSDRLTAIDMGMKYLGLYKQDNKQKAPNVNIQVNLE